MIVFFDTETSGLVNFQLPVDHPSQPHIIQLAAILCDDDAACTIEREFCEVIRPEGWYVQPDAEAVHGLSTEYAYREGKELRDVMEGFANIIHTCAEAEDEGRLVGHNVSFDIRMALREAYTLGRFDPTFISRLIPFCTMRTMTPICRIPHPRIQRQMKWPKLQEAYKFVFGEPFEGAHGALADAHACRSIFVEGRKRGWWN